MAPACAPPPNSVPCGPSRTSTRSMSMRYTSLLRAGNCIDWSSRYNATLGNGAVVDCDWLPEPTPPRPRRKMLPVPGPLPLKVTFGVYFSRSLKLTTFSCWSWSPEMACTVIGTSWMFSERRCAVTTTSPTDSCSSDAAAVDSCACDAAACAPRIAATATDTLLLILTLPPK